MLVKTILNRIEKFKSFVYRECTFEQVAITQQSLSHPWGPLQPSTERRFFISPLSSDAKQISSAVRSHWLIENGLHLTLDVIFNEPQ